LADISHSFHPGSKKNIEVPLHGPARLSDVLAHLGIPVSEVYLIVLNGKQVTLDETRVSDSDEVSSYSPIDGG
jgi:hypothetical protein